jgi:Tfp pilus assembly protein PilN
MSSESSAPARMSLHLPVGLLSLAIAIFLASQLGAANRLKVTMNWQIENLDKQSAQLKDSQKKLAELVANRDQLVKQAGAIKQEYQSLLNEVLELSKTDADALKVVDKYKIRSNQPETPAESKPEEKK